VAVAVGSGTPLNCLSLEQFREISPEYGDDVHSVFNLDRAFSLRTNPGAPNPANTERRLQYWKSLLA
jgi:argininosuccinate lyase